MYKLYLELDSLPKSLNKSLRTHHMGNHRANKMWAAVLALEVYTRQPTSPLTKAKITLVRHSYRMLDYDGLVGSMKPVVDALVKAGILSDDSWSVLGKWNVNQRFRPKSEGPKLDILVQECPDSRN